MIAVVVSGKSCIVDVITASPRDRASDLLEPRVFRFAPPRRMSPTATGAGVTAAARPPAARPGCDMTRRAPRRRGSPTPPTSTSGRSALAEEDRRQHDAEDGLERHHDGGARRPEAGEHDEEERERDRGRDRRREDRRERAARRHVQCLLPDAEHASRPTAAPSAVHVAAVSASVRGITRWPGDDVGGEQRDRAAARSRRRRRVIATCPPPTATIALRRRARATSDDQRSRARTRMVPSAISTTVDDGRVEVEEQRDRGGGAALEREVEARRLERVQARRRGRSRGTVRRAVAAAGGRRCAGRASSSAPAIANRRLNAVARRRRPPSRPSAAARSCSRSRTRPSNASARSRRLARASLSIVERGCQ